jgi:hypothetical protein
VPTPLVCSCCSPGVAKSFIIVDPNLIILFTTGDTDVPTFISRFSTSFITSSTLHVFISLFPVIISFVPVTTDISSDEEDSQLDFFVHLATKFAHDNGIVAGNDGFHPLNLYPALVGLDGAVIFDSYFHVIGKMSLPPSVSKVIV